MDFFQETELGASDVQAVASFNELGSLTGRIFVLNYLRGVRIDKNLKIVGELLPPSHVGGLSYPVKIAAVYQKRATGDFLIFGESHSRLENTKESEVLVDQDNFPKRSLMRVVNDELIVLFDQMLMRRGRMNP